MAPKTTNLTILFADISGSTRLYEVLGDAPARAKVATCLQLLTEITERFGGTVIKTIGDEIMCTFSSPNAAVLAATSSVTAPAFGQENAAPISADAPVAAPAPAPVPCTIAPHLVVIVWAPAVEMGADGQGPADPTFGVLEVVFRHANASPDDPPLARNVQPLTIEPGKFNYRLVRAELAFDEYSTIVAHCRIDQGPVRLVPYTLLPPVG